MTSAKSHQARVRKLKKRVTAWKQEEKAARNKLRSALSRVKKETRTHKSKLNKKTKSVKQKVKKPRGGTG